MIDGLSPLMTIRKSGLRPSSVWLNIGGEYIKPEYAQEFQSMQLVAHDCVKRDDFRAFKGLPVILYAGSWSQLAADALERLKTYADEITVLCADYGSDIGYFWTKEAGSTDMRFI